MRRRTAVSAAVAGAFLLLFVLAYAGPKDFWEAKPYTDWTASEVQKILQKNCPWTHVLLLVPTEAASGGRSSKGSPNPTYSTPIYISWNSRIVREAVVRKTMLEMPDTPKEQLDKALNYDAQNLEFFINGQVMGGRGEGRGGGMAEFRERTYLQKKNKEKIALKDVVMAGGRGGSMTLVFPRELDGKPTISPEDKEVTLVIRIGDSDYKFTFKLAGMMVNGKLEI